MTSLEKIITSDWCISEAHRIVQLQTCLASISEETIPQALELIARSGFLKSREGFETLIRNIFFLARFRPFSIEVLSLILSKLVVDNSNWKPLLESVFMEDAFHDEHSYKETWRFFFLYMCMKHGIYREIEIVEMVKRRREKETEWSGLSRIAAAWFSPEIKKYAPDWFHSEIAGSESNSIFKGKEENETRVFDTLAHQGITLDSLMEDDWKCFRESRDLGYTKDLLVTALIRDDVESLQKLAANPQFKEQTIEPSLFSRWVILQDSSSPLYFAAAVGAIRCFRFLLSFGADAEYETWNDCSTTLPAFAVAGGNNEIIRLVEQIKPDNFQEAVYVAVQYYRRDIFYWAYKKVFLLLDMKVDHKHVRYGTLIHRAAKANNVEAAIFLFEQGCDVNMATPNNDFFVDDRTPPLSEAIQFGAIDVAKLCLGHKDLTLVPQEEKQDSLIFEMIYSPYRTVLAPLFLQHKTFESALAKEKENYATLRKRCEEFHMTDLLAYFNSREF